MVRLHDRRKRSSRSRQLWRHLRAAMRLLVKHPIVSAGVVPVLSDGRVVLVRRVDSDRWSIPGGMMDWGETVEAAARRELEEETGLELVRVERLVGVYSDPRRDARAHAVSIVLAVEAAGEMEVQDRLEVSEIHAFPAKDLPFGYLAFDHEQQLRDYLAGGSHVR